ncbi:MAG: hypothetical protein JNJ71_10865 [Rubrivivax sp.]|nr:hypothetical protein [Rubrivivax sp.]
MSQPLPPADGRDPVTGRLAPGHSVAPRNRWRPGQPTQADLIKAKLEPHREQILDKAIELAKAGDPKSMALVLQYLAPPARPEGERMVIPKLAAATTLQERASAVIEAVADGTITAEAGAIALGLLDKFARLVTVDEHERRLAALEGRSPKPSTPAADVVDLTDTSDDIA